MSFPDCDSTDESNSRATVLTRGLRAIAWSYGATLVRALTQVAANIALARLLGPKAFGTYSIAMFVLGVTHIITEFGLGAALVQQRSVGQSDLRSSLTFLMLVGVLGASALGVFAEPLAVAGGDRNATNVIRVASLALLVYPFITVGSVALSRSLEQKTLQLAQYVAYLVGFAGVGALGAMAGMGPMALVAGFVAQNMIYAGALIYLARPPLRPLWDWSVMRRLRPFATRVVATNVTNFFNESFDNIWVGRQFGANAIGIYSTGYSLVRMPVQHLVVSLQAVLFPASARLQDDFRKVGTGYLAILAATSLVAFPFFATVAIAREPLVSLAYGQSWKAMTSLVIPFALAMPFQAIVAVTGAVLWGVGSVGQELKIQLSTACLLSIVVMVAGTYSPGAIAWGAALVCAVRAGGSIFALSAKTAIPAWRSAVGLGSGVVLALPIAGLLQLEESYLAGLGDVANITILAASATLLWAGTVRLGWRYIFPAELRKLIRHTNLANRVPGLAFLRARDTV